MALNSSYLAKLSIAHHDEVSHNIASHVNEVEIDNQIFIAAVSELLKARDAEDKAYHNSLVDPLVKQIKKLDMDEDAYMVGISYILRGHRRLPEEEPTQAQGEALYQILKNYKFSASDSYEAEIPKIRNIYQDMLLQKEAAEAVGVWELMKKAYQKTLAVEQLLKQRMDKQATVVVGELRDAIKQTNQAIQKVYKTLDAIALLNPSETVNTLIDQLLMIEKRSRQYYITTARKEEDDDDPADADGSKDSSEKE